MTDVVADTHAVVWYLYDAVKLSRAALTAASRTGTIYVSAISLVEVNYLTGKPTLPYVGVQEKLVELDADPTERVDVLPLGVPVAQAMNSVPKSEVPDMPDRIVVATAVAHRLPVVSADHKFRNSPSLNALVPVIW